MNEKCYIDFILNFTIKADFDCDYPEGLDDYTRLRVLWTAFCILFDKNVDTSTYDGYMADIWREVMRNKSNILKESGYERFYNFMSNMLM